MNNSLIARVAKIGTLFSAVTTDTLITEELARESLRESQRQRTSLSHISIWVILSVGLFFLFYFGDTAASAQIGVWVMLCLCAAVFRWRVCLRERKQLTNASAERLAKGEKNLLVANVLFSLLVGSGFWIVGWIGDEHTVQVIALVSTLVAISTVTNLSTNLRQFVICVSVNMIQGMLFFLFVDGRIDLVLVVTSLLLWVVLLYLGFRNALWFTESMEMRDLIQFKNHKLQASARTIQASLDRSIETNASKSHFIAAASHDLRQPLHSITMLLGILKSTPLSKDQHELVNNLDQSAETLRLQFDGLLELSKLEAGAVSVQPRQFDLYRLLRQTISRHELDAYKKGLSIALHGNSLEMQSDPVLIDRVLGNLIENAVKYTNAGEITIRLKPQGLYVEIHVIDTGIGISESDADKVFDEYVQVNNPARQSSEGVGMGLAVVKRIVELLSGKLFLTSDFGVGSDFKIVIPLVSDQPVLLPSLIRSGDHDQSVPNLVENVTNLDLVGKSILVVDDDSSVLSAIERYILLRNGKPCLASTIEEVQIILNQNTISAAILDDMLDAKTSGLTVAELVKAKISKDSIIIVSGLESAEREQEIQSAGYKLFKKPLGIEKMDLVLTTLLQS